MQDMIERLAAKGLAVDRERAELAALKQRHAALGTLAGARDRPEDKLRISRTPLAPPEEGHHAERDEYVSYLSAYAKRPGITESDADFEKEQALYLDARLAKRRLLFRDPDLAPLGRILFVKRHPYTPSHNYSDILDSAFRPGGGVCVLEIPRRDGRLEPGAGKLTMLFDARGGIARDAHGRFRRRADLLRLPPLGPRPGTAPTGT